MSTFLYNNARHLFATGQLDWLTTAPNAMLVSASYVPNAAVDAHVSDIPAGAIIVRDAALTNVGESGGLCSGAIPIWNALSVPVPVVAIVLYGKVGSDSTSPLIYYSSDGAGFPFTPQGFNYSVAQDQGAGGWFQV